MSRVRDLLAPESQRQRATSPNSQRAQSAHEHSRFTIEFILDTSCPHCYIGLRNMNRAIDSYVKQHPEATFEITCSPTILCPDGNSVAVTKEHYYTQNRGFAASTLEDWTRAGAEAGINFNWQGERTGNSLDSHKLLRLALESTPTTYRSSSFTQAFGHNSTGTNAPSGTHDPSASEPATRGPQVQMRLLEAIFQGYFEDNHDLADRAWLQELGTSLTGIPGPEIAACLASEAWAGAVEQLSQRNRQEFNVVPVFILQGRYVAGGWQRPELFVDIFERIRRDGPAGPGGTLSVPGGGWWLPGGVFRTAPGHDGSGGVGSESSLADACGVVR